MEAGRAQGRHDVDLQKGIAPQDGETEVEVEYYLGIAELGKVGEHGVVAMRLKKGIWIV